MNPEGSDHPLLDLAEGVIPLLGAGASSMFPQFAPLISSGAALAPKLLDLFRT